MTLADGAAYMYTETAVVNATAATRNNNCSIAPRKRRGEVDERWISILIGFWCGEFY